jgi:hypothetical protein
MVRNCASDKGEGCRLYALESLRTLVARESHLLVETDKRYEHDEVYRVVHSKHVLVARYHVRYATLSVNMMDSTQ